MFLQDGDPSQNSKLSKQALKSIGTTKFDIAPRSPDLNPIENVYIQLCQAATSHTSSPTKYYF